MKQTMETITTLLTEHPYLKTVTLTVLMILFFFVIRKIIHLNVNKKKLSKHEKVQLKNRVSQYLFYILMLFLFVMWFAQLQVFLVSILAVAAAIVLALKELIMCLTGGILINVSNIFKVGQRIEIDNFRGFVIEKKLLTTKILEIGPEKNSQQTTGDVIAVPNSLMLSKGLKNESYFKGFSIKSYTFKMSKDALIESFEEKVKALADEICTSYLDEAKKNISKFCDKEGLVVPTINPRTKIILEDGKDFWVLVKLPVKNSEIADVEQRFNRFFLDWRIQNIQDSNS